MQIVTEALAAQLDQEVTTLASCWKITRRDGEIYCFTDHDGDLVVDGQIYHAASGISPTAVTSQLGLAVDNLELEGMLSDEGIREEDLLSGRYDHAEVEIFMVDYQNPEGDRLLLKTGWLGEVSLRNNLFIAEVRGISSKLQQVIGEVYSAGCRAKLGDARCGVGLEALTVSGTVSHVEAAHLFSDSGREETNGYFNYGLITFTGGANEGLSMEVREFSAGRFSLFLPMPHMIAAGDSYTALAGCDKRFDTCITRFGNALNFRGEPHVPGTDRMMETSATRSTF